MSQLTVITPVEPIGIPEEPETSLLSFIIGHELSMKRIQEQFQQMKAEVLGDCNVG